MRALLLKIKMILLMSLIRHCKKTLENQSGSALVEVMLGVSITGLAMLAPLELYVNANPNIRKFARVDQSVQIGRQIIGELRAAGRSASALTPGVSYRSYDRDGILLGGAKATLAPAVQSQVEFEIAIYVADKTIPMNAAANSFDLEYKMVCVVVSFVTAVGDPQFSIPDDVKTIELNTILAKASP